MADIAPLTEDRRPTVRIIACHASDRELQPILWGLEEEGIPADIQDVSTGEAVVLAKQAAHMSQLNVGIAVNGLEDSIVLHHRDLSGECPLFTLPFKDVQSMGLRLLGTNAARLVKGEPLVFPGDDLPPVGETTHQASRVSPDSDEVLDLIVRTVLELLAKG